MKVQLIFIVLIQIILITAETERNERALGGGSTHLVHLGNIEGKSYFVDRSVDRNWLEAKAYCELVGLQLATIKTENEALFLKLNYDHDFFVSLYWIAARDSQKPRALSWDNTGTEPETLSTIQWRNTVPEYMICAAYSSWPTPGQYRQMLPCTAQIGTLCQSL